jgi:hypothetical protein
MVEEITKRFTVRIQLAVMLHLVRRSEISLQEELVVEE